MERAPRIGDLVEDFTGGHDRLRGLALVISTYKVRNQGIECTLFVFDTGSTVTRFINPYAHWAWALHAEIE